MITPLFTVITPTIGRQELEATCESIDRQNYPVQHVIVYDGLLDEKAIELIATYQSVTRKVVVMGEKTNNFGNTPRNRGWYSAYGDYILYLDDDDYYVGDTFKVLAEALRNAKEDPIWGIFPASRFGEMFFHKPPRSNFTVSCQFFHRKYDNGGNAIRFGEEGGYTGDGMFIDSLAAKYAYLVVDSQPLVQVDYISSGSFKPTTPSEAYL